MNKLKLVAILMVVLMKLVEKDFLVLQDFKNHLQMKNLKIKMNKIINYYIDLVNF